MISTTFDLIILLTALLLSAFFSASETALFSLKKSDLLRYSVSADHREKIIAAIMHKPEDILVTLLTINLFVNSIISAITTGMLLSLWGEYGHLIAIAVVTPLIIILCEISPKVISINNYEVFSHKIIRVLKFFHLILLPLRISLLGITRAVSRLFSLPHKEEKSITEEELGMAVKIGKAEGLINKEEEAFISNVLRFSKKEAQNVMIPRNKAVFIPYNSTIDEAMAVFLETGAIRAPVYKKNPDNVMGLLDSRELIPYAMGYKKKKTINSLIHKIHHYPASKELGELLNDFLNEKIQIAIVIDEYGGTAGVVTLYSILSEVMGKELIEWKQEKKPDKGIKQINNYISIISGDMQIDDFNIAFTENLKSTESETISGYILEKLAHFPKRSETINLDKHIMKVRLIRKNRIESVEIITKARVK